MKNTMQALVLEKTGSPFVLREVAMPVAAAGEVLVRIAASGINPLDTKIRAGQAAHANTSLPAILGMDLAGTVVAVGADVKTFRVGDDVYGMAGGIGGVPGSLAEFGVFDADLLALKPEHFTMREAAALPLIFITAWEGLVDRANVQAGQKVLIHGGAGGVGHVAIQLAVALGAEVYATGSSAQKDMIQSLGATAIDYRSESVEEYVSRYTDGVGFDVIYDTVGGATLDASFAAIRKYKGHVVSCLGWGTHSLAPLSFRAATYSGVFTLLPLLTGRERIHHGDIMSEATKLAEQGKLRVNVGPQRYTFSSATDAHVALEGGTTRGKLVIDIAG
ncbi:MAG: zinc-dependent alcohol dehydrogenase family protein [Herminiimonas sp.]|uniref:zinc-dependent alcohol dehydrogenase family protein n=1 Tax=Herminiimonas sp. TaxID=1926289 RepID=UPI00272390FE|nr:zinc-dependent alcohol dehydrogenase family protein [Herminiimonas sp.]MDO9420957.1 zinc-dependent alcohol dehydrogenase family protein [Herminiimonas sp.]